MVDGLKGQKRRDGRFFGRRVNCEYVPLLPAWAVGLFMDDPRKTPYLLVWRDDKGPRGSLCPSRMYDGEIICLRRGEKSPSSKRPDRVFALAIPGAGLPIIDRRRSIVPPHPHRLCRWPRSGPQT